MLDIEIECKCFGHLLIFIARQHSHADARYWCSNSVRPSVHLSARLSRSGILSKQLKICHTFFSVRWIQVRYINFAIFDQYLDICWKWLKIGT